MKIRQGAKSEVLQETLHSAKGTPLLLGMILLDVYRFLDTSFKDLNLTIHKEPGCVSKEKLKNSVITWKQADLGNNSF